ncbi:MAG: LptE family protein [Acidobacteriota bacterium]|nr:LPS assembly lipoprotein LptE [Blastocatellia bacterium]MDW8412304.1 LptE family protein [Acidobacteriota bacterium]
MKTLLSLLLLLGPCGYSLAGKGSSLPAHVKTIAVQTFRNDSVRYKVDQRFTAAVTGELLRRSSRFRVVSDPADADAVISGNIRNFAFRSILLDNNNRTRVFEVTITVGVVIRDQVQNKVLFDNQRLIFRGEYELADDPRSFFNEDDPAIDRIAKDFARSIVSTMMEGL